MLTTIPLLTAAAASYVQIPLSVAVGRRPVLLLASLCAWIGALWAGLSSSGGHAATAETMSSAFQQHLAARSLVGLGAGAVNALIPLVAAHDLVFLHQRHLVLAVSFAIQAIITAGLSAAAPFLAEVYDWRWMYYITGTAGFLVWLALVALVPETRWTLRTKTQLCGGGCGGDADFSVSVYADEDRKDRLDYEAHGGRTLWTDMGVFVVSPFGSWRWSRAGSSVLDLARTALLPAVVWVAAVQAVLLVAYTAALEMAATMLLVKDTTPNQFSLTGLIPGVSLGVAGVLTVILGAIGARFTLGVTRHLRAQQNRRLSVLPKVERRAQKKSRPTIRREAEHNLPGLVLPLAMAIAGSFVVGAILYYDNMSTVLLLLGPTFIALAMLLALVGGSVFLIESYPVWAGPCLAHANSWRFLAAFFLEGKTASLVARKGALEAWAVRAEVLIVTSLGLPALFFTGRWLRAWAAGTVQGGVSSEDATVKDDRRETVVSPSPSDSTMTSNSTDSTFSSSMVTATTATHLSSHLSPTPHPGTPVDLAGRHASFRDEDAITGRAL